MSRNTRQWDDVKQILSLGAHEEFFGGCARISISMEQMAELAKLKAFDMSQRHNESPTLAGFFQFAREHSGDYTLEGYLYPPGKDGAALSVDSIIGTHLNCAAVIDFANQFHKADEFEVSLEFVRAWYD